MVLNKLHVNGIFFCDNALTSYGFSMTEGDHYIYTKVNGGNFVSLSLYVDDILIASNDKVTLVEVKVWLSSTFDMKDMGEACYVLGLEIHRDRNKRLFSLSQKTYIKNLGRHSLPPLKESRPEIRLDEEMGKKTHGFGIGGSPDTWC
jgi:hypothetical protein